MAGGDETETHVKKYEQPRTWLCTKLSVVFSVPKSSTGSAHKISHINPWVGGSRKRSICSEIVQDHVYGTECMRFITYGTDIIKGIEFGGEAAVDAQELLVHDCGEG
jgi:hypothetical protein